MATLGQRVERQRWVHTPNYVVAVQVEAVIPINDPSEVCYEAETVEFLRTVEERARRGDLGWLRNHGRVYRALDVA